LYKKIKKNNMYNIDKIYGIPVEEISCPGCGQRYGHHNTKVDINSEECSSCAKRFGYTPIELVSAKEFIEDYLDYKPHYNY